MAEWIENMRKLHAVYKRPTLHPNTQFDSKRMEKKIFHGTNKQKSAQVATVISNKIDFNSKKDARDKKYIIF